MKNKIFSNDFDFTIPNFEVEILETQVIKQMITQPRIFVIANVNDCKIEFVSILSPEFILELNHMNTVEYENSLIMKLKYQAINIVINDDKLLRKIKLKKIIKNLNNNKIKN